MRNAIANALKGEIRSLIAEADHLGSYVTLHDNPGLAECLRNQETPLQLADRAAWIHRRRYILNIENGEVEETGWFLSRLSRFYINVDNAGIPQELTQVVAWAVRSKTPDGRPASPIADWRPAVTVLTAIGMSGDVPVAAFHGGVMVFLDAAQAHLRYLECVIDEWAAPRAAATGQDEDESGQEIAPGLTVTMLEKLPQSQQKAVWFAKVFKPDITRETTGWGSMREASRLEALSETGSRITKEWLRDQDIWIPPWFRDEETFLQQMASESGGAVTLETSLRYLREGLNVIDPPDRVAPMRTVRRAEHVGSSV